MKSVCILDKSPGKVRYEDYFQFPFTVEYLTTDTSLDKITKKDITINLDELVTKYDYIITIGSEVNKKVLTAGASFMSLQGTLVDDKYLPLASPNMIYFKPQLQPTYDKAIKSIHEIVTGVKAAPKELSLYLIVDEDICINYLQTILEEKPEFITMDTETTALYPRKGFILGISISKKDYEGTYIIADAISEEAVNLLQKITETTKVVFHHSKFDTKMLMYHLSLQFIEDRNNKLCIEDTMLMHYALDENSSHGLKDLAIKYSDLGNYDSDLDTFKKEYCSIHRIKVSEFDYGYIPYNIIYPYAAKDVIATRILYNEFKPYLEKDDKVLRMYNTILMKGSKFIRTMEENGVPINLEYLTNKAIPKLLKDIESSTNVLYNYPEVSEVETEYNSPFKVSSIRHVRSLLFEKLRLKHPGKLTETGALSVDIEVLESFPGNEVVKAILDVKKKQKVLNTYLNKMAAHIDRDGRLRTNFGLHTTTSGRLSSSGTMNRQQLPRDNKEPKKCIHARPGYKIVSLD
jgi:DNA polymerase I-like protein with 3'-5' exonuclease and polymerase domains